MIRMLKIMIMTIRYDGRLVMVKMLTIDAMMDNLFFDLSMHEQRGHPSGARFNTSEGQHCHISAMDSCTSRACIPNWNIHAVACIGGSTCVSNASPHNNWQYETLNGDFWNHLDHGIPTGSSPSSSRCSLSWRRENSA